MERNSQIQDSPLSQQIAASIEDVKALLDDNRRLSIAFLSRRIQDLEAETRKQFRTLGSGREQRLASLEEAVKRLEHRIEQASVKFKEMRDELDKIKEK